MSSIHNEPSAPMFRSQLVLLNSLLPAAHRAASIHSKIRGNCMLWTRNFKLYLVLYLVGYQGYHSLL
jgi:hypothetical protein